MVRRTKALHSYLPCPEWETDLPTGDKKNITSESAVILQS